MRFAFAAEPLNRPPCSLALGPAFSSQATFCAPRLAEVLRGAALGRLELVEGLLDRVGRLALVAVDDVVEALVQVGETLERVALHVLAGDVGRLPESVAAGEQVVDLEPDPERGTPTTRSWAR